MKKTLIIVCAVITMLIVTASPVFASGDKVRGDNGEGSVVQVQVQDPPPFQP